MFKKILIVNRGEIAKRILKSCLKFNIKPVCIYSDIDANTSHLMEAYKSICISGVKISEGYLNPEKLIEIAQKYHCEAIHPGYGFLSENYLFALQCKQKNITFIGPEPRLIQSMGDKLVARDVMNRLNVPVVPGSFGHQLGDDELMEIARAMEFPILIKAVAGGGGKGMKIVHKIKDVKEAITRCRFESQKLFGNDRVYIEKFIDNARHIEIQIAGDNYGNIVHFHERDCSVQRNNQKLLEEAPAPNCNQENINNLKRIVISAMRKLRYNSLCTLEFLLDHSNRFYFIEANTRLQVEHPVTELTTGYDLVSLQIRIASGENLGIKQENIKQNGHAIECRINAEDPKKDFKPSTGRITHLSFPIVSRNVRIDSYVRVNTDITPFYDSMICKIIVHNSSRSHAIDNMEQCLKKIELNGITTSTKMQIEILRTRDFKLGKHTCNFIKENIEDLLNY